MEDNNNVNVNGGIISKEKIDQVATWVGSTVSSAFFSSLERFSCVNVATSDPDDNDDDDDDVTDYSVSSSTTTTTAAAPTTGPPVVQVNDNNAHTTNDASNLPV